MCQMLKQIEIKNIGHSEQTTNVKCPVSTQHQVAKKEYNFF